MQPLRATLRVTRPDREADLPITEVDLGGDPVVAALEDRRAVAPRQELRISLGLLDHIEHDFGRVRDEHRTTYLHGLACSGSLTLSGESCHRAPSSLQVDLWSHFQGCRSG